MTRFSMKPLKVGNAPGAMTLLLFALLAGCSGGQGRSALPIASNTAPATSGGSTASPVVASGTANTTIRITVPPSAQNASVAVRHPAYVSPATQSISLVIMPSGSSTPVYSEVTNLSPGSPGCASSTNGTVCTIQLSLPPGSYFADATTYTGTNGTGTILSDGMQEPFSVGTSSSNLVALTLSGVPHAIQIVPISPAVTGTAATSFLVTGPATGQAQGFTITALDAAGNAIVGPGSPSFTLTAATSHGPYTISQPTAANPNQFAITPPNVIGGYAKVTATAQYSDSTCSQSGAVCSTSFIFNYSPFVHDDWITFAHDFLRTGRQTQATAITPATLSQLAVRWKTAVPGYVDTAPLAWKGNILVVNETGTVYDLSAADGSVLWKTSVGGQVLGTPSIDTIDGLVFVMNRLFTSAKAPAPSQLTALSMTTGTVAWQTTLPGPMRSSPVYYNGVVYEGWAGGDAPACLNGGVAALNATTGTINWKWLTNPGTNPGGGGGIWGGIGFDGYALYFGTGNVCAPDIPGQEGVVSLALNGTTRWAFTADANVNDDDDTGGAVLLQNGVATALNKDGTLFALSAQNGSQLGATPLGAAAGLGGYASPTSDGSIVVVGAGLFPTQTSSNAMRDDATATGENWRTRPVSAMGRKPTEVVAGYTSYLKAVGSSGNILWSIPMNSRQDNFAAIYDGMVFAGLDTNVEALNIQTGSVLWTFPGSTYFAAPPAIVPSGMYFNDQNGNVYALNVPQPTYVEVQSKLRQGH